MLHQEEKYKNTGGGKMKEAAILEVCLMAQRGKLL